MSGGDKGRFVISDSPPLVNPQPPGAPWHQPKSHSSVPKELHTREVTSEDGRSVCTKPFPFQRHVLLGLVDTDVVDVFNNALDYDRTCSGFLRQNMKNEVDI